MEARKAKEARCGEIEQDMQVLTSQVEIPPPPPGPPPPQTRTAYYLTPAVVSQNIHNRGTLEDHIALTLAIDESQMQDSPPRRPCCADVPPTPRRVARDQGAPMAASAAGGVQGAPMALPRPAPALGVPQSGAPLPAPWFLGPVAPARCQHCGLQTCNCLHGYAARPPDKAWAACILPMPRTKCWKVHMYCVCEDLSCRKENSCLYEWKAEIATERMTKSPKRRRHAAERIFVQ